MFQFVSSQSGGVTVRVTWLLGRLSRYYRTGRLRLPAKFLNQNPLNVPTPKNRRISKHNLIKSSILPSHRHVF